MIIPTKIKKLLEQCKHCDAHTKKLFMPIVELAVKQHEDIKKLENEIKSLRQPSIFKSAYPNGAHVSKSLLVEPSPPKETTAQWINRCVAEGQTESDAFLRFLKWKKWQLSDALEYAAKESKQNE
jgi:hypothetical protein